MPEQSAQRDSDEPTKQNALGRVLVLEFDTDVEATKTPSA